MWTCYEFTGQNIWSQLFYRDEMIVILEMALTIIRLLSSPEPSGVKSHQMSWGRLNEEAVSFITQLILQYWSHGVRTKEHCWELTALLRS